MKFVIKDRYSGCSPVPEDKVEFENLEEFVKWSVQVNLPRFIFVPPHSTSFVDYRYQNITDDWIIYCFSGYD